MPGVRQCAGARAVTAELAADGVEQSDPEAAQWVATVQMPGSNRETCTGNIGGHFFLAAAGDGSSLECRRDGGFLVRSLPARILRASIHSMTHRRHNAGVYCVARMAASPGRVQ